MLIGSSFGHRQRRRAYICKLKEMWVMVLLLFLVFSSSLSFKSIYWLPIGCRSILLKPISFLFLGLWFWVRSHQLLSSCRLTWACQDWFHAQNPSFLCLQPQWQLRPPQGKLINYGWMFDWQRLNDRSSVLTRLPYTENLVPIVLFKTCQMITEKLFFAQRVELAFPPFLSAQDIRSICMFMQMISWRMKLNIMEGDKWI